MLSKLYKLLFDLGICHLIGVFLLSYLGGRTLQPAGFIYLLITGMAGILLERRKKLAFLALGGIPVIGLLLLRPEITELMVYLVVWGYLVYVVVTKQFMTGRGELLDRVKKCLYLALLLPLLMLTERQALMRAVNEAVPYLIVVIVSIGFQLRQFRTDAGMKNQKDYKRHQLIEMVLFLSVCVLLTLLRAPQNLQKGISLLFTYVIRPVFSFLVSLISIIFSGVMYLIISLMSLVIKERELAVRRDEMGDNILKEIDGTVDVVTNREWILPLLYSIGIILALFLLFLFLRWLIGERYTQRLPEGISEIREDLVDGNDRKGRRHRKYSMAPRDRVRFYYYKYLLFLHSIKVGVKPWDTTQEIELKHGEKLLNQEDNRIPALNQMKELYRKARYSECEELTAKDADQAKELYRKIKSIK